MAGPPIRALIATMVVSFVVSFAVLWSQRAPPGVATTMVPVPAGRRPALSAATRPPDPAPIVAEVPPAAPAAADSGPPLPVVLAVSSHAAPRDEDSDGSADSPAVARQVDIINESDQALDITVLVADPTQQSTRTSVFLLPHAEAHPGIESGLKIEPGDTVTLRSAGFGPVTQTVP
jgi:hypothetical protein